MAKVITMRSSSRIGMSIVQDLRAAMRGRVVQRGEGAYAEIQKLWNTTIEPEPEIFASCESIEDVQAAVRITWGNNVPLSVHGGGHNSGGRAIQHNGLVIDLSLMRSVEVDTQTRVATIVGDAQVGDVITATVPHGLVAVTGNNKAVGFTDFMLGGGYGPLSSRFGLAIDNMLGVEIILHTGKRVLANASENSDLFWALRGGGGNFGVVTSVRIQLHAVDEIFGGIILFPWSEAEAVLRGYAAIAALDPDDLGTLVCVVPGADGNPVLLLAPIWTGDRTQGAIIVERLESLGTTIMTAVWPMYYSDFLDFLHAQVKSGCRYATRTCWLSELTSDAISTIVQAGSNRTSPRSVIAIYHFRSTSRGVHTGAVAFSLRRQRFLVESIAAWEPEVEIDGTVHEQWAETLPQRLASAVLPGCEILHITE